MAAPYIKTITVCPTTFATTINVAPNASYSGSFDVYYKINAGAWTLLVSRPFITTCPTFITAGTITTASGNTLYLALTQTGGNKRFAASPTGGSPLCSASPTSCGESTPYTITVSGTTTQYLSLQIVSGAPVAC